MTPHDCAEGPRKNNERALLKLREVLETVYGVDPAELNAIADPIWQNVNERYNVAIP